MSKVLALSEETYQQLATLAASQQRPLEEMLRLCLLAYEQYQYRRRTSMMGQHRPADKTSEESARGETAHAGGRLARQPGRRCIVNGRAPLDYRCPR